MKYHCIAAFDERIERFCITLRLLTPPFQCFRTDFKKTGKSDLYDYPSTSSSSSSLSSSSQISTDLSSGEVPPVIYRNALHVAVAYDAADVVRLLLRYSVDPESTGICNQSRPFETDNNFNVRGLGPGPVRTPTYVVENAVHPVAGDLVCVDESSVSSRSGSNSSSTNRVYCPLHILPKSLVPKSAVVSSSKSVQASPQRSANEASPLRPAAKPCATRVEAASNIRRTDEKDSGE